MTNVDMTKTGPVDMYGASEMNTALQAFIADIAKGGITSDQVWISGGRDTDLVEVVRTAAKVSNITVRFELTLEASQASSRSAVSNRLRSGVSTDLLSEFVPAKPGSALGLHDVKVEARQMSEYNTKFQAADIVKSLQAECCCPEKTDCKTLTERKNGVVVQDRCCRCCWIFETERVHHIDLLEILHSAFAVVTPFISDEDFNNMTAAEARDWEADSTPYLTLDLQDFGRSYASGHGFVYALELTRTIVAKGSIAEGVISPRFKDPDAETNNEWVPQSVPRVKPQEWKYNYLDGNIADNPLHPTPPDKLVGPSYITEWRRAKYIAVSQLTSDFLDTTGTIRTYEGDLENDKDMIGLMSSWGQFGQRSSFDQFKWDTLQEQRPYGHTGAVAGVPRQELGPGRVNTTQPLRIYGDMQPFSFITASDWYDRYHQYRDKKNDRSRDPVDFKNELTEGHT